MSIVWEIQKILDNPLTQVKMRFFDSNMGNETITGYMIDETFGFGSAASYSSVDENSILGLVPEGVKDFAADVLNKLPGKMKGLATYLYENKETIAAQYGAGDKLTISTIKKWDGSEAPQFTVGLLFVAISPEDNPEQKAIRIAARCFPSLAGPVFLSPMGYQPFTKTLDAVFSQGMMEQNGLCVLSIGQWFEAYNLLLVSADFEASKECIRNGSPLYVTGKVTFVPYRDISYSEYLSYFKNVSSSNPTTGVSSLF